jgi:hypothetical protein
MPVMAGTMFANTQKISRKMTRFGGAFAAVCGF